jgi:hypothetical protein
MLHRDYHNPHRTGYQPLHGLNLSSFWWHSGGYWSSFIEKEIIEGLKEPVEEEGEEKKPKFKVKVLCTFVAVLALLSIGMCIHANSITQILGEVTRISVQQAIEPLND